MDWARSASIFCCPRTVFFLRRELDAFPFAEAVWVGDFFPAEEVDEGFLWPLVVVVDFAEDDFGASDCVPCAAAWTHPASNKQVAAKQNFWHRVRRINRLTLNPERTRQKQKAQPGSGNVIIPTGTYSASSCWACPSYGSVPGTKMVPSSREVPRCRTRNTTSCPLFMLDSTLANSSSLFTGCLFTSRMMSPRPSPISSAKEFGLTSCTITPLPAGMSSRSAISGVSLRTVRPNLLCLGLLSSPFSCSSPRRAANSLARSAIVTVVSCCLPLRKKPREIFEPGLRPAISETNSEPLVTFLPS